MADTGQQGRTPPGGELSHAKKQVAAPADLLAEKKDRGDDDGYGEVDKSEAEARSQARKPDHPEGGRDAKAQGNDHHRAEDGDKETPSPPWIESDRRPNRASLTTWNGEGDGECDRDHPERES
jgi:hypothetical protein